MSDPNTFSGDTSQFSTGNPPPLPASEQSQPQQGWHSEPVTGGAGQVYEQARHPLSVTPTAQLGLHSPPAAAFPDPAQPQSLWPTQIQPPPQPPVQGQVPPQVMTASAPPHDPGQPRASVAARRGPGWPGVIAVGAGAALLSSLLTAGIVGSGQGSGSMTTSSVAVAASSQAPASVITGTGAPDWAAVAKTIEPSVVAVKISGADNTALGEGSGVILDTAGHILTNNHVVSEQGTAALAVVLADGRIYPATVVGTDPTTDLAVIKLNSAPSDLKAATFADSNTVTVGQSVMAVGNPLGLAQTATTGIVSAVDRPVTTGTSAQQGSGAAGDEVVTNAIQTDAAINPGNSGGALVDAKGQVIGITSSIASLGSTGGQSGSIGLGFAIPSSSARTVANEIISTGKATHAYLGVSLDNTQITTNGAAQQAAVITRVGGGTPAAAAGLSVNDSVVAADGHSVESADSLVAYIRQLQPGAKVNLTVITGGKSRQVSVTLASRPAAN